MYSLPMSYTLKMESATRKLASGVTQMSRGGGRNRGHGPLNPTPVYAHVPVFVALAPVRPHLLIPRVQTGHSNDGTRREELDLISKSSPPALPHELTSGINAKLKSYHWYG